MSLRVLWLTMGLAFLGWTALFVLLQIWEHQTTEEKYQDTVRIKAEMLYHSTQALRRWIGGHGGVYVAVDKDVKPNPLLAAIPERDVVTPSGRHLTLYNSPAFLRQVMTEFEATSGNRVRLVSLHPINPANRPDAWERIGFAHLSPKSGQYAELTTIDGQAFYRLMSPMILREPCLRCHAYDKSAIGSLIGAVSVSVDAGPDFAVHEQAEHTLLLSHTSMWLVGTLGMILGGWRWRSLLLKLERSAVCDPLTGLYNRRELMSHLDFTTAGAERYQTPLSLIMLDIDHFKDVNDSYGHQAGDEVLQTVARIMRDSVRSGDLLARYGGEEFTIVCPHTEGDGAIVIAERIRRAVMETPVAARTGKIPVTLSAGIATYPRHGSAEKLLKDADQALYEAKRSGRNRVCRAAPTEAQAD